MKITLRDTKPSPVWISKPANPGANYYRVTLPARMCGGRVIRSLQVLNPARQIVDVDLFDDTQRARFMALPAATILNMGDPFVLRLTDVLLEFRPADWTQIIRSFREAGLRVCLDFDDYIWDVLLRGKTGHILAKLEEARQFIFGQMRAVQPWVSQAALDRWWEEIVSAKVDRKIDELASALSDLLETTSLIASTERLKASTLKRFPNAQIAVAPNCIDPADFPPTSRKGDVVRIGYCGTSAHGPDTALIMPGLTECAQMPGVEILLFGWHPLHGQTRAPGMYEAGGLRYRYGGEFSDFSEFNRQIGALDVALAPLRAGEFNDAKASQKFFESAVHGTAMVLQDSCAYACATHDVDCLKAKDSAEFTRYMKLLVENAELRRRMGGAARQAVLTRHTVSQWAEHWRSAVGNGRG